NTVGGVRTAVATLIDGDGDPVTINSYQWQRSNSSLATDGVNVGIDASYGITTSDKHQYLRAILFVTDGYGGSGFAFSTWVPVANSLPTCTAIPVMSGGNTVGSVRTTSVGTWTDADGDSLTYTYQWQRADDANGTNAITLA